MGSVGSPSPKAELQVAARGHLTSIWELLTRKSPPAAQPVGQQLGSQKYQPCDTLSPFPISSLSGQFWGGSQVRGKRRGGREKILSSQLASELKADLN